MDGSYISEACLFLVYNRIFKNDFTNPKSLKGYISKEDIVEVKCLYKVASTGKNLTEAVKKKEVSYGKWRDQIKEDTTITTSGDQNNLFVEEIPRNDLFWQNILAKLTQFYVNCIAPQIILNRRGKKENVKIPTALRPRKKN
ncbi:hypothetical protein NQ317_000526 [Molorchus minor]|uniref:Uncharacterized protein n=1 Tax=Molorchus minor TaxID=1323400 RepID=A0ABQ9J9C5_9CUCU|nr:hypothetical protein NQ317_000526 [Molorchus minor]